MNYSKPEVAVLGQAALTIQGTSSTSADQGPSGLNSADCEFDD
jgi:hypothetical protein